MSSFGVSRLKDILSRFLFRFTLPQHSTTFHTLPSSHHKSLLTLRITRSSNPEQLQQMLRMASMFQGAGLGGGTAGGFGGANPFAPPPAFPAPGNPNPTSTPSSPSAAGQTPSSTTTPGATPGAVPPFPLFGGAGNLPAMQQMFGMPYGPGAGGLGGFGGFGGAPAVPATPADTRPPEERFQVQLQVRLFIERGDE